MLDTYTAHGFYALRYQLMRIQEFCCELLPAGMEVQSPGSPVSAGDESLWGKGDGGGKQSACS